jgi:hypothetical protein
MRRVMLMLSALAMVVSVLAGPVAAAPGGNAANSAKCEEGGYLDYTDAERTPFKNEGQCTSYAAKGGQLVPVPTADISLDQAAGSISGTGFTPNSSITLRRVYSPNGEDFTDTLWQTDATGAFTTGGFFDFCFDPANTSVEVTATDGAGVSVTESFPLSCGSSTVASTTAASSVSDHVGK